MPPDPPRVVLPFAVALSVPEKNPTFSQNLTGNTCYYVQCSSVLIINKLS